jgi:hypothetical protein
MIPWSETDSACTSTVDLSGEAPPLQPERVFGNGRENFVWIRRNPLKSPDSAKEGNASLFAWFSLLFLAGSSRARLYQPGFRR